MRLVGRKLRCCLYILCTADVSFVFETRQRVSIICAPAEERVGHPCIHFLFFTPDSGVRWRAVFAAYGGIV